MKITCKIWVSAKTEDKAIKLIKRLEGKFERALSEITIEPYLKINGFVITSILSIDNDNWNDSVVAAITLAQSVGYGWQIGGNISEEFLIGSSKTNISGIESINLMISKQSNH